MTNPNGPAPGWYPDPNMAGTQRYWDGNAWSEHAAPLATRRTTTPTNGYFAAGLVAAVLIPLPGAIIGWWMIRQGDDRGGWVIAASCVMFGLYVSFFL